MAAYPYSTEKSVEGRGDYIIILYSKQQITTNNININTSSIMECQGFSRRTRRLSGKTDQNKARSVCWNKANIRRWWFDGRCRFCSIEVGRPFDDIILRSLRSCSI